MKRLNNKGLSIVEFIVVFVILMVLIFGMMDTIMGFKDSNNTTTMNKELLEYQTTLTKIIQDNLIKRKFEKIEICDTVGYITECTFVFEKKEGSELEETSKLIVDLEHFEITYDNKKNHIDNPIKYPIPNSDFIEMAPIKIEPDETKKFLIISIPIYELDRPEEQDINYGINIIHPIGLH